MISSWIVRRPFALSIVTEDPKTIFVFAGWTTQRNIAGKLMSSPSNLNLNEARANFISRPVNQYGDTRKDEVGSEEAPQNHLEMRFLVLH